MREKYLTSTLGCTCSNENCHSELMISLIGETLAVRILDPGLTPGTKRVLGRVTLDKTELRNAIDKIYQ